MSPFSELRVVPPTLITGAAFWLTGPHTGFVGGRLKSPAKKAWLPSKLSFSQTR